MVLKLLIKTVKLGPSLGVGVGGQLIKWKSQAFGACCAGPVERPLSQGFKRTPPSVPVCQDASGPCKSGPVPWCLPRAPCCSSQGELEDVFSTRTRRKRPWRAAGKGAHLLAQICFLPCELCVHRVGQMWESGAGRAAGGAELRDPACWGESQRGPESRWGLQSLGLKERRDARPGPPWGETEQKRKPCGQQRSR